MAIIRSTSRRKLVVGAFLSALAACEGPAGPQGPKGDTGPAGSGVIPDAGPPAVTACSSGCSTAGLAATITVSAPANGKFFVAGERPELTIKLVNKAGEVLAPKALGTANLYVSGPREPEDTTTAVKLMNAVTDRTASDRQHHAIYLGSPHYADPTQANLTSDADGTLHYKLAAVSDEKPGTYTAGVWGVSSDLIDQIFVVADLQIGTAAVETYATGAPDKSNCLDCHHGTVSGKNYMAHIIPGFSPFGNYALDSLPTADCKLCHNGDGYSPNPIVRKVHGAHRGENMKQPGVAHPDYGLGADNTLKEFTDVAFPSFPGAERDCVKCHADDRWKTEPSRLACGTCHDNVFFDTGTLDPARVIGKPAAGACTKDLDCAGELATCNTSTGNCERHAHPVQTDDSQCVTCHTAEASGLAPIADAHEITQRTRTRGLTIANLTLSGASGGNGVFRVGDTVTATFTLTDRAGKPVADLATNSALSGNFIMAGPTDAPQRVLGDPIPMKTQGTLTVDSSSGTYTYVAPKPIPVGAAVPFNADASAARADNPAGTYGVWIYVNETLIVNGAQVRDAGNGVAYFPLGADQPVRPRQVILRSACDSCHVVTQAHGGSRQDAEGCWMCHNKNAQDRGVGAIGNACKVDSDCAGNAAGWEACGSNGSCVITTDPTPGRTIDFKYLVHSIHFARLRDNPTTFAGFRNTLVDLSEILLPMDVRNCTKCHADSGATCSAQSPCGAGQSCVGGTCRNQAWLQPSANACLACHDGADAVSHAALQTLGPVETCTVCHGPNAEFAVDKVHAIANPYVPPYPRTKE